MKLAIMQPYFFPYVGYFQLINAVDEFVIYNNIEFTKKGWINRNRILVNGKDVIISLPLKKDSDFLNVNERFLANTWDLERKKMLNKISEAYRKAPYYKDVIILIEKCLLYNDTNLFNFIFNSIKIINDFLLINTKISISSSIDIDHKLKSVEKVIAICKKLNASTYVNPPGGIDLYNFEQFKLNKINLIFHNINIFTYDQFNNNFIPSLSIIDVLMFNDKEKIINILNNNSIK